MGERRARVSRICFSISLSSISTGFLSSFFFFFLPGPCCCCAACFWLSLRAFSFSLFSFLATSAPIFFTSWALTASFLVCLRLRLLPGVSAPSLLNWLRSILSSTLGPSSLVYCVSINSGAGLGAGVWASATEASMGAAAGAAATGAATAAAGAASAGLAAFSPFLRFFLSGRIRWLMAERSILSSTLRGPLTPLALRRAGDSSSTSRLLGARAQFFGLRLRVRIGFGLRTGWGLLRSGLRHELDGSGSGATAASGWALADE